MIEPRDGRALTVGFMDLRERTLMSVLSFLPVMALIGPPLCGKTTFINELVEAAKTDVRRRMDCSERFSPITSEPLDPQPTPKNVEYARPAEAS